MPRHRFLLAATFALPLCAAGAAAFAAAPAKSAAHRPPPAKAGDVLRLFDKAKLYIVTNSSEEAGLVDSLLEGTNPADRRVMSVEAWRRLPREVRQYVTVVFLIDRQALPADAAPVPDDCSAKGDQTLISVTRTGRGGNAPHTIVLSAPDAAWLRAAVGEFRTLAEAPRTPRVRNCRTLTVVPFGENGTLGDTPRWESPVTLQRNVIPPSRWQTLTEAGRLAGTDEVILIDRASVKAEEAATVAALCAGRSLNEGDAAVWRERKPGGDGWRTVLMAPNADTLAEALRRCPNPAALSDQKMVLVSARDLRQVRRVAVAGLRGGGAGEGDLARRLAGRVATDLRTLDAFEVLERAGLNEVLGEIALGQAGITQAKDRARIQQMAAADALLIVEVTEAGGHTEYAATTERLTPKMAGPPRRPLEPSRLKYAISLPGKENDPVARALTDALLARSVGRYTDDEYRDVLNHYNRRTLPAWQQQVEDYNAERARRRVEWREQVTPRYTSVVSGSLRLVDLTDGMVLWESPFSLTSKEDGPKSLRTITTRGEDSVPDQRHDAEQTVPDTMIARAAESAVQATVQKLRGTALLPASASGAAQSAVLPTPAAPGGRILDIDAGQVLVGLGQMDGLRLGDTLRVDVGGGQTVTLTVTRVRPRTCDCAFEAAASATLTAKVAVGMTAEARR